MIIISNNNNNITVDACVCECMIDKDYLLSFVGCLVFVMVVVVVDWFCIRSIHSCVFMLRKDECMYLWQCVLRV